MKKMELWTAYLPVVKHSELKCGVRPVIIVSNNQSNEENSFVTVIPLTRNCASQQKVTHALLTNRYLDSPSRALCEQIITLDKKMLIRRIGYVDDAFERLSIRHALSQLLAVDGVA